MGTISPNAVQSALEANSDWSIQSVRSVSGGDINEAFCISLSDDQLLFLKANSSHLAQQMFKSEALGLQEMASHGMDTPSVVLQDTCPSFSFLVLEWIDRGNPSDDYWEDFGRRMAQMHRVKQPYYGWHQEGFIGTLSQPNTSHHKWIEFFWEHRLEKQFRQAVSRQLFSRETILRFGKLGKVLDGLFPPEFPSLLHGDLWSGNVMAGAEGKAVVYDPATYYGHREMDIAMTRLFGGFPPLFYQAYQEVYPLDRLWEKRIVIGQLYYILVHVNLFGGSYVQQADRIIRQYT